MLKTLVIPVLFLVAAFSLRAETSVAGVTFKAPGSWQTVTPNSPMRVAQWTIPARKSGTDAGEVVLFYFGAGQGGDAQSNVQRWLKTMAAPTGGRAEGEMKERTVDGMKVTEVVAYGTYASGMPMAGVPPVPKPDYGLAGVIIEGPQGNLFVRLIGPEPLVKAQLANFRQFVDSAKTAK